MSDFEEWKRKHKFTDDDLIVNRYWSSILSQKHEESHCFPIIQRHTGYWDNRGVLTMRLYTSELFSSLFDTVELAHITKG